MKNTDNIKVKLINKNEVMDFFDNYGRIACVCYNTPVIKADIVAKHCLESGHLSGSRGCYFIFDIECPRYTADQIMRHQVGTFMNCQSQRYVEEKNIEVFASDIVIKDEQLNVMFKDYEMHMNYMLNIIKARLKKKGYKGEQINDFIRTLYPIGVFTKLRIGFTFEALINFMNKRLCVRADYPIRLVAMKMRELVLEQLPELREYLVPQCEQLMYCPEKCGCGKYPNKKFVELVLDKELNKYE